MTSRWLVLALVLVAAVVGVVLWAPWGERTVGSGAESPEDAAGIYVHALNRWDEARLRDLSITDGPTLDAGIKRRFDTSGGKGITVGDRRVRYGPAPHQASVNLVGRAASGEVFSERIFLNRVNDHWFVNLHDIPEDQGTPPLPTANTSRP
ncbi:hypothetical protein [Actinokineospora globicatena]|uniref:hypothetical protein n=1 Tax=Actinokineospora globicatena TaxID=103729 RepID=UPI002555A4E2|nr:hypothetical protein [Actinokineospora globicatena]